MSHLCVYNYYITQLDIWILNGGVFEVNIVTYTGVNFASGAQNCQAQFADVVKWSHASRVIYMSLGSGPTLDPSSTMHSLTF